MNRHTFPSRPRNRTVSRVVFRGLVAASAILALGCEALLSDYYKDEGDGAGAGSVSSAYCSSLSSHDCCRVDDPCGWANDGQCDCSDACSWDHGDCSEPPPTYCPGYVGTDLCCTIENACEHANDGSCQCDGACSWDEADCQPEPEYCPGYVGTDECCVPNDPCGRAENGACDCGGSCHWDPIDCNQGMPDLLEPEFHFQVYWTSDPCCSVSICINRTESDTYQDFGDFVRIHNGGVSDAPPFIVGVGIGGPDAFQYLAMELEAELWLQPGYNVSWDGNGVGFCRTLENVPPGTYHVWAVADWYGAVTESNETDNAHHSTQSFTLP